MKNTFSFCKESRGTTWRSASRQRKRFTTSNKKNKNWRNSLMHSQSPHNHSDIKRHQRSRPHNFQLPQRTNSCHKIIQTLRENNSKPNGPNYSNKKSTRSPTASQWMTINKCSFSDQTLLKTWFRCWRGFWCSARILKPGRRTRSWLSKRRDPIYWGSCLVFWLDIHRWNRP